MNQVNNTHQDDLVEQLKHLYTGAVHDVLRSLGVTNFILPNHIRPLNPAQKMAGPIWTVSGKIDTTKTAHETLLGWTGLLSKAPRGHVVVCQPNNQEVALMGELSAETLQNKGVITYLGLGFRLRIRFLHRRISFLVGYRILLSNL